MAAVDTNVLKEILAGTTTDRFYIVKQDDTFKSIALKIYGNITLWVEIYIQEDPQRLIKRTFKVYTEGKEIGHNESYVDTVEIPAKRWDSIEVYHIYEVPQQKVNP